MREHPILFSGPMVRAILEGRKTQTRRVVRQTVGHIKGSDVFDESAVRGMFKCAYGQPGDRLWVRETWTPSMGAQKVLYQADYTASQVYEMRSHGVSWKPSIHMPRWASRITLEVTEVRVQRLQDIGGIIDVAAEGCSFPRMMRAGDNSVRIAKEDVFKPLWDSINSKRPGCAWTDNPWVWAVSFKHLKEKPHA